MANKSNLHYPRSQKIKSNRDAPQVFEEEKKAPVKKESKVTKKASSKKTKKSKKSKK